MEPPRPLRFLLTDKQARWPAIMLLVSALGTAVLYLASERHSKPGSQPESPAEGVTASAPANRLAGQKSPYLLQHAHNPVDWYPWGEEAFAKARKENKPIFLSIGYSTCHWCHVMAHESFENTEIAKILNDNFVSIKVDREERPDVDRVYMQYVVATTGSGGWPMSVWLTPDLKPFVGGTYFPPDDAFGRPGFASILKNIAEAWKTDREDIVAHAGKSLEFLRLHTASSPSTNAPPPAMETFRAAFRELQSSYDKTNGGFGPAPKFPRPVIFDFLHHYAETKGVPGAGDAVAMSADTLRKMTAGGIHDHLGGGFHRYSVDGYWHVPHFEKMLYDQAQLVTACLDAHRLTRDPALAVVARDILAYVSRDMTSPDGGFYSAEDADSLPSAASRKKVEGAFYVWERKEVYRLPDPDAELFSYAYGVKPDGNVPPGGDPHDELKGKNILIRRHDDRATAERFKLTESEVATRLTSSRATLLRARSARPRPNLDDKIITGWNGLMISAYAKAYQELGDRSYRDTAVRAANFILNRLYDAPRGVLKRAYREGWSESDAFASDYAFMIRAMLDLYDADHDTRWLDRADALQSKMDALFADPVAGGYFSTSGKDASVLLRTKESYDGEIPSENSVAASNLLRLATLLDRPAYRERALGTLRAFAGILRTAPVTLPEMLVSLDAASGKAGQLVIVGDSSVPDTQRMISAARARDRFTVLIVLGDEASRKFFTRQSAFYGSLGMIDGKATAYLCENFVCRLPTNDPALLLKALQGDRKETP